MNGISMDIKVEGLAQMFRDLGRIDPELRKAARKNMFAAGRIIQNDVRKFIPTVPPMSGWARRRGQRGRWVWSPGQSRSRVSIKVGTGSVRKDEIRLLTIRQSDPAGVIFDMAGRKSQGNSVAGRQFIRNLNTWGRASRTMWPAVEDHRDDVERALREAVDDMARTLRRMR